MLQIGLAMSLILFGKIFFSLSQSSQQYLTELSCLMSKFSHLLCLLMITVLTLCTSNTVQQRGQNTRSTKELASLNNLFYTIPTHSQVLKLIQSANTGRILKLVQILGQLDHEECFHVVSYLGQLHGTIQYIAIKKETELQGLKTSIEIAEKQIKRANSEIERLNGWQQVLQLSKDKMQLSDKLNNLTRLYNVYNQLDDRVIPQTAKISGYERQILDIEQSNEGEREKLLMEQLRLTEIQNNIASLQKQLGKQKIRKSETSERIWSIKKTINDNDIKIATIKNIIANIKRTIEGIQNRAISLKISYSEVQIEAQRLKSQIQAIQKKQDELTSVIRKFEAIIRQQETKLTYYKLDTLQFEVKQLRDLTPSIKQSLQSEYQECFIEASTIKTIKLNGKILYVFQPNMFSEYIKGIFGLQPAPSSKLKLLSKVDLYGQEWLSQSGSPSVALQYLDLMFPNYQEKLICGQFDRSISGQGQVVNMKDFRISIIGNNRQRYELIIGPCSTLESSTKMPQIGQRIYWRGVRFEQIKNHIHLYWGTLY